MTRSSKSVWMSAYGNVPGLPPCPSDLNEVQYANLLFSNHCHVCALVHLSSHSKVTLVPSTAYLLMPYIPSCGCLGRVHVASAARVCELLSILSCGILTRHSYAEYTLVLDEDDEDDEDYMTLILPRDTIVKRGNIERIMPQKPLTNSSCAKTDVKVFS